MFAEGRGFTLSEIKLAGIPKKQAKGLGIVVDHRRRSKSEESQKVNVERLKEYRTRLVVFPRKAGKPKAGDATVSGAVLSAASRAASCRDPQRSATLDCPLTAVAGRGPYCPHHPRRPRHSLHLRSRGSSCHHRGGEGGRRLHHPPSRPRRPEERGPEEEEGRGQGGRGGCQAEVEGIGWEAGGVRGSWAGACTFPLRWLCTS
jgi:hypothetical protein